MIIDYLKRIVNGFLNDIKEAEQDQRIGRNRNRTILTAGRYIGGIDIPCGIYNIKILSGVGTVDTEDIHNEKDRYFCVRLCLPGESYNGLNHFPPSYNGLKILPDMVIKIGETAKIEFLFSKEIRSEWSPKRDFEQLENRSSRNELNSDYDSMDGWQFENFCADVLKNNGYENVEVTKGSGDQGVDILAERDGIKYAIQCKHYSQSVGNKAVQEIFAGKQFYHCHVGIIMTNNHFTQSAKELARENGIILWDRDYLNRFTENADNYECTRDNENYNQEQELSGIEQNESIRKHKEKREEKKNNMYDREKGIYPPGIYVVGEDIEIGKYILNAKNGDGKDPFIAFYENYSKYRKDEANQYERFDDDYYVSLRENGMVISVRDADIKRL